MDKLRNKLYGLCGDAQTKAGIAILIEFYINNLGWTEKRAIEYAIELFENGTIEQIKIIGGNDDEN